MVSTVKKSSSGSTTSTTTYKYTYDKNGNITEIRNSSNVIQNKYYYDDLGQLIREDNRAGNYTLLIKYDEAGNILGKVYVDFTTGTLSTTPTTTYTYGNSQWCDLLTKINGDTITYDGVGNPTAIGYNTTLSWQGRQLMSITDSYIDMVDVYYTTTSYTYNSDGIRTSKNVNGVLHEYILDGSRIVAEKWGNNLLVYLYDEAGSPIGLKYRTSSYSEGVYDYYFFEKNIQGDIIAVYNSNGTKIGTYVYDAWGQILYENVLAGTNLDVQIFTEYNPFRYRGYYYDVDTGWYYLQSRYYNPEWGRFISIDKIDVLVSTPNQLTDKNFYAYCDNDPINRIDNGGEFWEEIGNWLSNAVDSVGDWINEQTQDIVNLVETFEESIVVDAGIGDGVGLSIEVSGMEGSFITRNDYYTIRKDAGSDFYIGRAEEFYTDVKGFFL